MTQIAQTGRYVAGAGIGLGLVCVFFALPPFWLGIWYKTEPLTIVLHICGALVALGLALGLAGHDRRVIGAIVHPFVLLPIGLALWSMALLPFAPIPALSWFGTPEIGEGIARLWDLGLLIAGGRWLWRYRRARRIFGYLALTTVLVATATTLHTYSNWKWSPFGNYDHLAFFGIFGGIIFFTALPKKLRWPLLGIAAIVVFLSGNRAAVLFSLTVFAVSWMVLSWLSRHMRQVRMLAGIGILVTPVVVGISVVLVGQATPESSLWSRWLHMEVIRGAIEARPEILAVGTGWGGHTERQAEQLQLDQVDFWGFEDRLPDWDALRGSNHYHSHSFLLESLMGAGLVGMILAWLLPASVPLLCARRRIAFVAAAAALTSAVMATWPLLSSHIPYWALALVALSRPAAMTHPQSARRWIRPVGAVGMTLMALALSGTAYAMFDLGQRVERIIEEDRSERPAAPETSCNVWLADHDRGGVHLGTMFRSYAMTLARRLKEKDSLYAEHAARLDRYICAYRYHSQYKHSRRLATAGLIVRSELAFTLKDPALTSVSKDFLADWGDDVAKFLDVAPNRSDMASPYLQWNIVREDDDAITVITRQILKNDPKDPIGLWFAGYVMLADPAQSREGFAWMNEALDLGLQRRIPIEADLYDQIRAADPRSAKTQPAATP